MTDDLLLAQLRQALGSAYAIERELGGGGMSRVFVARDTALDRLVVVKLLPAELTAGLSAERFRREIQLAARLQHPHIVPLLAAGTAGGPDGLLYYTMPFIDGSSLRARIAREGALPIADVVRLLREVASALGYAHRQGLVHRDIKPDNILLSGGHALVTDFGIAKALISGATPAAAPSGVTGLTSVGTAIGTPAYMAPEQGVGDPSTDHRADLYALGVVAYEMLTGATPFGTRTTPHQLLMAHMVETPPPIAERRPDIPSELSAIVTRLMAKSPDDRPATAEVLVAELDALGTGGHASAGARSAARDAASAASTGTAPLASAPSPRRRAIVLAGTLGLLSLAAVALLLARRGGGTAEAGATPPQRGDTTAQGVSRIADRVIVLPLANETGDAALAPVGRMAADWLTRGLAQTGLVKLVDAQAAFASAPGGDSPTAVPVDVGALAAARGAGAGTLVTGRYYKLGDSLYFQLRVVDATTGEIDVTLAPVSGPAGDPTAALDRLNRGALGALAARFNPALADYARQTARPPTYEAYQAYVAGNQAMLQRDLPGALARFREAGRLDTSFVAARFGELEVLENLRQLAQADTLIGHLQKRRATLSPLEQAMLDEYTTSVRGDLTANLAAAFRMHALSPGGQFRATLATKLMNAGRLREALDTLEAANAEIGIFEKSTWVPTLRMRILHHLGEHERALAAARTLRKRFPADPTVIGEELTALAALGRASDLRAMEPELRAIPGMGSLRTLRRNLALEMMGHGHEAPARTLLAEVLASYDSLTPDSAALRPARAGRALTLSALGRHAEAYAIVKPDLRDTALANVYQLAPLAAWAGDRAYAAQADARMAAQPVKYSKGAWHYQRARLAAALGDRARAVALLRDAQQQGLPVHLSWHSSAELRLLKGEPGFEELIRPRR